MDKRTKNLIFFIISFIAAFFIVGYIRNTMFVAIHWVEDVTIWDKFREYYIRTFISNIIPALIIAMASTIILNSIKLKGGYKLWIFFIVILVFLSIIITSYYSERVTALEKSVEALKQAKLTRELEYAVLQRELGSLESEMKELRDLEAQLPFPEDILLNELRHTGFKDEIQDIAADLRKHPELIPYTGVLGGTMDYAGVRVLSDKWVLAYIEDGHIGGYMLLSYKWNGDRFRWKVINAYIMGQE